MTWLDDIKWDDKGLVPVIAQEKDSGDVLMFAWMNREALQKTAELRRAVYFSRSRNKLWFKVEESGHVQTVHDMRMDCDNDVVLLKVTQEGHEPGIASGGVGNDHLADGVQQGGADAVLAASIFHYGEFTVQQAKERMREREIPVRL